MSVMKQLRVLFVCAVLELGALSGVPMRADDIRALMDAMNRPPLAHQLRADDDRGDGADDEDTGRILLRTPGAARMVRSP